MKVKKSFTKLDNGDIKKERKILYEFSGPSLLHLNSNYSLVGYVWLKTVVSNVKPDDTAQSLVVLMRHSNSVIADNMKR